MRQGCGVGVIMFGVVFCWSTAADAHFYLVSPASRTEQDGQGDPQKTPSCGDGAGATFTGAVTTYAPGETITITIDETITHPGHYRVAIAPDPASLPADPVVTPADGDACASAAIQDPPQYPVLADGMLQHDASFGGDPQSFQVTLPDTECQNCVLQVVEFMSSHGAPCFYYHCATINIDGDPAETTDGGSSGGDASTTGDSGSGTTTSGGTSTTSGSASGSASGAGTTSGNDSSDDTTGEPASGGETDSSAEAGGDDGGCSVTPRPSIPMFGALLGLLGLGRRLRRG